MMRIEPPFIPQTKEDYAVSALEAVLNHISGYPHLDRQRLRAILRTLKDFFSDTPAKIDSVETHTTTE